jgi:hypothetical protein
MIWRRTYRRPYLQGNDILVNDAACEIPATPILQGRQEVHSAADTKQWREILSVAEKNWHHVKACVKNRTSWGVVNGIPQPFFEIIV